MRCCVSPAERDTETTTPYRALRKSIALIALAFACATPRPEQALPEEMTYDVSVPTLRDAVLATLEEMQLQVETSDEATGIIRSARAVFRLPEVAQYMDCGDDPLLGSYTARPGFKAEYLMNVRLSSDSTGASLRVRASFFGRTNGRRHSCVSLGRIEREFLDSFKLGWGGAY